MASVNSGKTSATHDLADCAVETERQLVLVADDDPIILAVLGAALRQAGFEVLEASDGRTALQLCLASTPRLAIIDYAMPGLSGIELAHQISRATLVPFIFLSAYEEEAVVRAAVSAGAMTYLLKPIDTRQLLPVVRAALERSREIRALRSQTERLTAARDADRNVGIATGVVMTTLRLGRREAFERLRRHARSSRSKLEKVVTEIVQTADDAGRVYESLGQTAPVGSPTPET
ncbi:MAG TPA: response regulator [Steroidobacteraceae bacterium]|nr:response regulator [Steroidobacteraceae bacterium]